MNNLLTILILKPVAALIAWITKHPVWALLVWLVLWFLPPLGVILYALSAKALGEGIGKMFIETRWAKIAFVLAVVVFLPPVGVIFTSWLFLDLFKPNDRVTVKTLSEATDAVKQGISGIFDRLKGKPVDYENAGGTDNLPTVPPPNPVIGGEIIVNPNVGVDGTPGDFGGVA